MAFGDAVTTDTKPADADWIAPALGEFGTVGGLVPTGYDAYLLIDFRTDEGGLGWDGVQQLFAGLVPFLTAETSTPDECFFAIWEGYGFGTGTTVIAFFGDDVDPEEQERMRRQARQDDAERKQRVSAALSRVVTFELPHRRYYLVRGAVDAVARITSPDGAGAHPPDLWWPQDRQWFVGGDTDLDWCYLGGSRELIESVRSALPARTQPVPWDASNYDAGLIT